MKSRWATMLLLVLFAAMSMGGSFTCYASNHDHDHDQPPPPKSKAP